MVNNRPYKAPLGIYSLKKPGKEPMLNRPDSTKTKAISKRGLKKYHDVIQKWKRIYWNDFLADNINI